ncbi:MAG TPA: polysaccharide deacetylase family protein [Bacteroidales bacterium]|nr:polysaccharide deacetylase family protein [Bacteroidales bacterium]HPT02422.1 polysaccharide deacetylase family protein [Bacteroidales bacterium]
MRRFLLLWLIAAVLPASGQQKKVCISVDDLPVVSYGIQDTVFRKALINKLIASLKKNDIPAIGFVNEQQLYEDGHPDLFRLSLIKSWVDNGLDLGNHTFSHPDYNKISYEEYTQDIIKGETLTKPILESRGRSLKYFRHPYLHVGDTKAKADSLAGFLSRRGYTVAPVTIDNEDYLFALAYHRAKAKNDTALALRIGHDYLAYMERKALYFERQAGRLFGRDISQILLIHASRLNADYIDSLAMVFRKNGYVFVSMDQALHDEAYQTEVTVYGAWGISWMDRWALSQGKKRDFFTDDPETPEYIHKLAE